MKKILLCCLILSLAACATIRKIEPGSTKIGERLSLQVPAAWNHVDYPYIKPGQLWTLEGVTIDELMIYSSIKEGQTMHASDNQGKQKNFVFHANMQTEEIVSMFEGVLSRDQSTFKLIKLEPYPFGGKKGFRFEYERVRKSDNVYMRGVGYGSVDRGELFSIIYQAPRLTFYPKHIAQVENLAKSALIN